MSKISRPWSFALLCRDLISSSNKHWVASSDDIGGT